VTCVFECLCDSSVRVGCSVGLCQFKAGCLYREWPPPFLFVMASTVCC
jgi:hypothetical protein